MAEPASPAPTPQGCAGDLAEATWPEVAAAGRTVLLLPLGSTEQHGPHLPLSTDTVVASRLAALAHRERPQVGLAPAVPYGASGEHAHFPGTLSIGTQALTQLLVEFVRHADTDWRHVLVVNGHGGNAEAVDRAIALARFEGRSLQVFHAASGGPRADPHAGHRETSLMLYLAPELVRRDLAAPGPTDDLGELMPRIRTGGVRAVSRNGVLGDPTGADALEGARILRSMAVRLVRHVDELLVRS